MLRHLLSVVLVTASAAASAGFSIESVEVEGAGQPLRAQPAEINLSTIPKPAAASATLPTVIVGDAMADQSVVVRANAAPAESWIVSPADATLRHVLAKWTARAGWQLVWEAPVDVPVTVSASFDGDFRSAVKGLFSSLSAADVNLTGLLYTGNRVLRVTEPGRRAQ